MNFDRYRQSIDDERAVRSRAEQRYNESVRQNNDIMERMRKDAAEKEEGRIKRVAELERQLADEKNRPRPPKKKPWYKRAFHAVFG